MIEKGWPPVEKCLCEREREKQACFTFFSLSLLSFFPLFSFSMSRPSRRALPPDRFGEAADDKELDEVLTSSSSEDDNERQQRAGAARRRITTTTFTESDDDEDDDVDGQSENLRGADSATTSARPASDSECDGTRTSAAPCDREHKLKKQQRRARRKKRCRLFRWLVPTKPFFFFFIFFFLTSTPLSPSFHRKKINPNAEETSAPNPLFYRLLGPQDITPKLNGRKVRERRKEKKRKRRWRWW